MPAPRQPSAVDLLTQAADLLREQNLRSDLQEGLHELAVQLAVPSAPELTVWYGPMPESNGRSNFTAILMRKGGDVADGHTIDRSEYPDRVRYEADRVRYLIGDLPEKPFILDYDAEKHSGYEPPARPVAAGAGKHVATVVAGNLANRLEWVSDEAHESTPVGAKLYCSATLSAAPDVNIDEVHSG